MNKKLFLLFPIVVLLVATPLAGVIIKGEFVISFLQFPFKTEYVSHEEFSLPAFLLIIAFSIAILVPFAIKIIRSQKNYKSDGKRLNKFPFWGWIGIVLLIGGWIIAWSRFQWFEELQTFTFTPPWLGYIVLINALTYMRIGKSLITHSPKYLVLLFLFSAVFWWYYEYLNQFVNNWYYTELDHLSDLSYFLYATLSFSTVLPAVISTWLFLKTFPRLSLGIRGYLKTRIVKMKFFWWLVLLINLLVLALMDILPQYLFPFIWLSPMLIIASIVSIAGGKTIFHDIAQGNWKDIYLLAVAALICGFFWEMWNYYSFAKWEYSIPFVHRYLIFEMPFPGYLGYLPFGIQCGFIGLIISSITKPDLEYSMTNTKE
jgi:hypothetical protein